MSDLTPGDIDTFTDTTSNLSQGQVDAALQIVRMWCRWHIAPARTETLTTDGACSTELTLPTLRLNNVTEIRVTGTPDPNIEWWNNGTLRRTQGFQDRPRLIEADVTHGFDWPDVQQVLMAVASIAHRVRRATGGPGVTPGVEEKAIGSFRVRWTASSTSQVDLTMGERIALEGFRIPLL